MQCSYFYLEETRNIVLSYFENCGLVGFIFCEAAIKIVDFDVVEIRHK